MMLVSYVHSILSEDINVRGLESDVVFMLCMDYIGISLSDRCNLGNVWDVWVLYVSVYGESIAKYGQL